MAIASWSDSLAELIRWNTQFKT